MSATSVHAKPRCFWVMLLLMQVVFTNTADVGLEADAYNFEGSIAQKSKGYINMYLHFPNVDFAAIKADSPNLQRFKADIKHAVEEGLKHTGESIVKHSEVCKVKTKITDIALANPDWDDDDDEHDYDDDHPSREPPHAYPLDNVSTVVVMHAFIWSLHDHTILKSFKLLLLTAPQIVFMSDFATNWGVPECLASTYHIFEYGGGKFSDSEEMEVLSNSAAAKPMSSTTATDPALADQRDLDDSEPEEATQSFGFKLPRFNFARRNKGVADMAAKSNLARSGGLDVDWVRVALGGITVLLSTAILALVVISAAQRGSRPHILHESQADLAV